MNQQYPNYTQAPQGQPYQSPRPQQAPQQAAYTQPYNTQPPQYQPQYQPQYAQQPYAQPQTGYVNYVPNYSVPPFAISNVRKLRKKAGARAVNRMSMLAMAQLVCSILWQIPIGFIIGFAGMDLTNEFLYILFTAALVPLSTALPAAVYLIVKRNEVTDYLKFERKGFLLSLLCVIAGLGICMAANYPAVAIQEFLGMFGYERQETVGSTTTTVGGFILELLVVAVLVPILEEFAFRGVIFSSLKKYGVGFAIAASGLIFGCMHLDLSSVVFATICGVVFGFVYVITDNLWVTVAIHALNNAISVITNDIGIFVSEEVGNIINTVIMIAPIILGVGALTLLLVFFRKKLYVKSETREDFPIPFRGIPFSGISLSAGETAASIVRAPATWVLLAAVLIQTALSCIEL